MRHAGESAIAAEDQSV